jgi:hypothetical protein
MSDITYVLKRFVQQMRDSVWTVPTGGGPAKTSCTSS